MDAFPPPRYDGSMKSTPWILLSLLGLTGWIASSTAQTETNNAPAPTPTTTSSAPATTTSTNNGVLTLPPPNNPVTGTVNTYNSSTNNAVDLPEDQKDRIRNSLRRAQLTDEQKKRQAELLDKTPVLEDKINPGMTEKGGIPKRF